MRLRVSDRIFVAIAGILLIAVCAAFVAQMFCGVDLINQAQKLFSSEKAEVRIILTAAAVLILLLGLYCVLVLFRHRGRKDKFILQKNDNGELAISVKALENMVSKCLDQHEEIKVQNMHLENRKDGLLIRIRGSVSGGISIPLTLEAVQRQIKQYVTACSGVEVKSITMQIDASGKDAENAPFAIEAPSPKPLLKESNMTGSCVSDKSVEASTEKQIPGSAEETEPKDTNSPKPVKQEASIIQDIPDDDDDRPLHQRLFSAQTGPCIVPVPPENGADIEFSEIKDESDAASEAQKMKTDVKEIENEDSNSGDQESFEESETVRKRNDDFIESQSAFDRIINKNTAEEEKQNDPD